MHPTVFRSAFAAAAISALLFTVPAAAETINLRADLSGANEVPANARLGVGGVQAIYDTVSKKLAWVVTYTNLTGPVTGAHFHGPAATTANAPVIVPVSGSLNSPIGGEATLTDAQAADLLAGRWYFNIHTSAQPDGEIRGQVARAR
jgi:hypothetical protein